MQTLNKCLQPVNRIFTAKTAKKNIPYQNGRIHLSLEKILLCLSLRTIAPFAVNLTIYDKKKAFVSEGLTYQILLRRVS